MKNTARRFLAIVLIATLLTASMTAPTCAAGKKSKTVKTTKVILSQTGTVKLSVGETLRLIATVKPSNSTQKVIWSSSKKSVATVKNGKVTARKAGTATITAKSGKKSAKVKVKVVKAAPTGGAGTLPKAILEKWLTFMDTHNDGTSYRFHANGTYDRTAYEASGIGWYSVTYSGSLNVKQTADKVYRLELGTGKKTGYEGEGEYEKDDAPATRKGMKAWLVMPGGSTSGLSGTVLDVSKASIN